MHRDHVERRLSAIMVADIVGYSRLVEADEADALAAIKALRSDVIEPLLKHYHGHIAKLMGDGAIIEFGSVVDAVTCGVELQNVVGLNQAHVPPDRRLVFRIGINVGDIVVEGDDLLGDGVNVAARLEQLCDPGGILVSGTAYDQLQGKLSLPLDYTGEQQVKNMSRPVRTYRVRLDGSRQPWRLQARRFRRWTLPVAAVLVFLVGGSVAWLRPWEPRLEAASVSRMALPLPDKPSIAVLPLSNLGDDPKQGYFADGMTEDLITDLSHLSGIFVIARNSTSNYKDKPIKQVAEDLGVRYVLQGSVRREGNQVRVDVQLIDAVAGRHLWADRYDSDLNSVFAVQDKVVRQVVAALAVELTSGEQADFGRAETNSPQAYDAVLEGWEHLRRDTEDETLKSIPSFERAIELDPNYARAYAALAAANWRIAVSDWESANLGFQKSMDRVNEALARSMRTPNPLAYAISAEVLAQQGRYDEAFAEISRAMSLAPSDADNHASKAKLLNATGRAVEAEQEIRLAMRLNPQYPLSYLRVLALAQFFQKNYEKAVETLKVLASLHSDAAEDYGTLVSSLGHLGRTEGVQLAIEKFNSLTVPAGYSPLTVQETGWFWYGDMFDYNRKYRELLQDGLRKAGVPEGAGTDLSYDDYSHLMYKTNGEYNVTGATKIDAATAKQLHDRGVIFIDARSTLSFDRGHVPGAVSLPVVTVMSKDTLSQIAGKDDEIIFSCHGKYCGDSAHASAKALAWGFTRVYYFAGGFPAWVDAAYPVEVSKAK